MRNKNCHILLLLFNGLVVTSLSMLVFFSCASIGRLEGGDYDETPPVLVSANPSMGATNVSRLKATLYFDENVKLDKPGEKIVISPPQSRNPEVKANGKRVSVTFRDTLIRDVTYSVDFSDAIQDNNEGNPLEAFSYSFSTGDRIDTLAIAGKVINARDLEPVKGMMVGIYSDLRDSAFLTRKFDRVGRTDSRGYFSIRGIAPGQYRIFALEDADANYFFSQPTEAIAFSDSVIVPIARRQMRNDTTWVDSLTVDTIRAVEYTHFYPDNIFLRRFKQENTKQRLASSERLLQKKFTLNFTANQDSLPLVQGIGFDATDAFVVDRVKERNDTLDYWIRDSLLYQKDTIWVSVTYHQTDSLDRLVPRTDTLRLVSREKKPRTSAKSKEKRKEDSPQDSISVPDAVPSLEVETFAPSTLDIYDYLSFTLKEPFIGFDSTKFHLQEVVDTLYYDVPFDIQYSPTDVKVLELYADWKLQASYQLLVDSAAMTGLYGLTSRKIEQKFKIKSAEEYGQIFFNVSGAYPGSLVELISTKDEVIRTVSLENGRADFYYLAPGNYGARLVEDTNGNGKWDTGRYSEHIQPETVLYFPRILELKANFDITQDWNVNETAIDAQKPADMVRQKPDTPAAKRNRNQQRNGNQRSSGR